MSACVLIVEDNAANLELMTYLLRAFGYGVLAARDGESGLERAQREIPDLILCDIQMPGMSGYELARRIRESPSLRRVPLVAVTAFAMVGDREKALAAGFDGYIPKPIEPETFVQEIERFLPGGLRSGTRTVPAATDTAQRPGDPPGRTILVVDNEPANLDFAVSLLEPFGHRVLTASDPRRALELARMQPPDLIVSDVCMPKGTGYEFIRECKRDPALKTIPFVFVTTTMNDERERETGLSLGAAKYLFRPMEPQEFMAEIDECLRWTARP